MLSNNVARAPDGDSMGWPTGPPKPSSSSFASLASTPTSITFEAQAEKVGRTMALEGAWRDGVPLDDTPWEDFPFLAAEELWSRLTPHLLRPELVADRLEEAIRHDKASDAGDRSAARAPRRRPGPASRSWAHRRYPAGDAHGRAIQRSADRTPPWPRASRAAPDSAGARRAARTRGPWVCERGTGESLLICIACERPPKVRHRVKLPDAPWLRPLRRAAGLARKSRKFSQLRRLEPRGFEPLTFCMPCRRAPSCAMAPMSRKSLKNKSPRLSTPMFAKLHGSACDWCSRLNGRDNCMATGHLRADPRIVRSSWLRRSDMTPASGLLAPA